MTLGHSGANVSYKTNKCETKTDAPTKKVSAIQSKTPWSSSEDKSREEVQVFHINKEEGYPNKPFVLKGKFQQKALPRTH